MARGRTRAIALSLALATALIAAASASAWFDAPSSHPAAKPTSRSNSLKGKVVTIDPGHNGRNGAHPEIINRTVPIGHGQRKACDTAGTASVRGLPEAKYTWLVAKRVRKLLRAHGAKVVLTRHNNHGVGPCINKRAKIGNKAHSDAAVSIHADGGPSSGRGFHVIYPTKIHGLTSDIYRPSKRLAHKLRFSYHKQTKLPTANYIGRKGLDARGDLGGLRLSNVPKVFIETANMRNSRDARKLGSAKFRKRIAYGIYRGLVSFIDRKK